MEMTLADAAKATKRSKQALSQAIKKGRLSATRDANGTWQVDSAELFRVYPPEAKPLQQEPGNDLELLRSRLATLEALHQADRELIEELRRARDDWQTQAERLLLALPGGRACDAVGGRCVDPAGVDQGEGHAEVESAKKPGWWSRIFMGRTGR